MDNILRQIADNEQLFVTLKKLLEDQFSLDDLDTRTLTNEAMGQMVRARVDGLNKINEAFKTIAKYKTPVDKPESINPAR